MIVELKGVSKKFGRTTLFENINLKLEQGAQWALLGKNGSGKSTLLQIISTFLSPTSGSVDYRDNDLRMVPKENVYLHLAMCTPALELIEEMTLEELLTFHFSFKKGLISVREMISYIGLEKYRGHLIEKFSSGMKQRVKLAQAFFSDTAVLLLDEPCTNLDEEGIRLYLKLFTDFAQDKTVEIGRAHV